MSDAAAVTKEDCRCVRASYYPFSQSKCSAFGDSQNWHQVQMDGCVFKEIFTAEGNAYSFSFLSQGI